MEDNDDLYQSEDKDCDGNEFFDIQADDVKLEEVGTPIHYNLNSNPQRSVETANYADSLGIQYVASRGSDLANQGARETKL